MIDRVIFILERLKFLAHPVSFEVMVPYPGLRERLIREYHDAVMTKLLVSFPDLFVMHQTMQLGVFFACLTEDGDLDGEKKEIYRRFFPADILLIWLVRGDQNTEVQARWFEDSSIYRLTEAISRRFPYKPPTRVLRVLEEQERWQV